MSGALSLVVVALFGTALLVGIAFLMGFSQAGQFASLQAATDVLTSTIANVNPQRALLASNRRSALILCDPQRLFLLVMLGDAPVVRVVDPKDIALRDAGRLNFHFKDIGFPSFDFLAEQSAIEALFAGCDKVGVR